MLEARVWPLVIVLTVLPVLFKFALVTVLARVFVGPAMAAITSRIVVPCLATARTRSMKSRTPEKREKYSAM